MPHKKHRDAPYTFPSLLREVALPADREEGRSCTTTSLLLKDRIKQSNLIVHNDNVQIGQIDGNV